MGRIILLSVFHRDSLPVIFRRILLSPLRSGCKSLCPNVVRVPRDKADLGSQARCQAHVTTQNDVPERFPSVTLQSRIFLSNFSIN
jgi:hypothetical protein